MQCSSSDNGIIYLANDHCRDFTISTSNTSDNSHDFGLIWGLWGNPAQSYWPFFDGTSEHRSRSNEKDGYFWTTVTSHVKALAHPFFKQTTASTIDFYSVFNLKLLSLPALVTTKSDALLNDEAIFQFPDFPKGMRREVQIARIWLNSCKVSSSQAQP